MATYKVLQDIEAEDKLIGPFGIRQFIYLLIVAGSLFLGFRLAIVAWFLAIPLLPHTIFFALLALPFGGEQPTETWLLAKIRFSLKPRVRIWNQSGVQELVTITAPKKIERQLTKGLSQYEVQSRLQALASTIDSRGWAVKNVDVNLFSQPAFANEAASDRLIAYGNTVQEVPSFHVTASDDILDEQNNPTAQNLDRMINASSKSLRKKLVDRMTKPEQPGPQQQTKWFQSAASPPVAGTVTVPTQAPAAPAGLPLVPLGQQTSTVPLSEDELLDRIHQEQTRSQQKGNSLHVVKTLEQQAAEAAQIQTDQQAESASSQAQQTVDDNAVTPAADPVILDLANNDDLNVETIARQANKRMAKEDKSSDGEVVINLH